MNKNHTEWSGYFAGYMNKKANMVPKVSSDPGYMSQEPESGLKHESPDTDNVTASPAASIQANSMPLKRKEPQAEANEPQHQNAYMKFQANKEKGMVLPKNTAFHQTEEKVAMEKESGGKAKGKLSVPNTSVFGPKPVFKTKEKKIKPPAPNPIPAPKTVSKPVARKPLHFQAYTGTTKTLPKPKKGHGARVAKVETAPTMTKEQKFAATQAKINRVLAARKSYAEYAKKQPKYSKLRKQGDNFARH